MISDHDLPVGDDARAIEQRKRADLHTRFRAEIKHDAQINRGGSSDFDGVRLAAAKELETVGGLDVGGVADLHVVRDCSWKPVITYFAVRGHDALPMICAGLPMTRVPAGTS